MLACWSGSRSQSRRAGADEQAARRAYAAVHTYTIGFAALEASRAAWAPPQGGTDGLASELATYTASAQFAEGLAYLLDGIDHRSELGRGAGRTGPARQARDRGERT